MKLNRSHILCLALMVAAFAFSTAIYPSLPELVPSHWGFNGQVDGYARKAWGAFGMPAVMVGIYLLLLVVDVISPRGYRIEPFRRTYDVIRASIIGWLFLVNVLIGLAGLGTPIQTGRFMYVGLGILIVVLGNFMGKLTRNFFIGIRTPWTLASEEVWSRTHRIGGKLFVLAGLAAVVFSMAGLGGIPIVVALVAASVASAAYSYVLYRRIEEFKDQGPQDPSAEGAAPR